MAEQTVGTARVDIIVDTDQFDSAIKSAKRSTTDMSTAAQQQYAKLSAAEKRRVDSLINQANKIGLTRSQQIAYNAALKTNGPILDEITRKLAKNAKGAKDVGESLNKTAVIWGTALGNVLARGLETGARALASFVKDSIRASVEVERFSRLTNSSANEFQRWAAGAEQVGIQQDKLADILKDVQDKVGDFLQTGGGELKEFFEKIAPSIGLTAEQMAKMSGPQALGAYVRALQAANVSQSEMVFHMEALANDSTLLLPLLLDNAKGMREAGDQAERLGAIMDDEARAGAKRLQEAMVVLDQATDGVKLKIAEGLTPALADMAEELQDPETQRAIADLAEGLGAIGSQAIRAAGEIAKFASQYASFLKERGLIEGDTIEQLETRRDKLVEFGSTWRGRNLFNRNDIYSEIASIDNRIEEMRQRALWGNVQSGSSTTETAGAAKPRVGTGTGGKKPKALPDFAKNAEKELQKLLEAEARAREQFDAMAATLEGPLAAAHHQYLQDQAELNELAKVGAVDAGALAQAQANLARQYEQDKLAIEARLDPGKQLLADLKFEIELMKMGTAERAAAIQMRGLDEESVRKYGAAVVEANRQIEDSQRAIDAMDNFRDAAEGFLIDLPTKGKGAWRDFLDDLSSQLQRWAARGLIEQLFGAYGTSGQGSAGGGWLNSLIGAFSSGSWSGGQFTYSGDFGFARGGYTGDGSVMQPAGIVHRGEYVIPASSVRAMGRGYLDQIAAGRAPGNTYETQAQRPIQQVIQVTGRVDNRTAHQIAAESGREIRFALSRY